MQYINKTTVKPLTTPYIVTGQKCTVLSSALVRT